MVCSCGHVQHSTITASPGLSVIILTHYTCNTLYFIVNVTTVYWKVKNCAYIISYATKLVSIIIILSYVKCDNTSIVFSYADNQLTLTKAFERVCRLSSEWYEIGSLLNVPKSSLSTISINVRDDYNHLNEMLKERLKQTDPPPTWHELAEAVEPLNRINAQIIRQCCCVGEERYEEGMNHCLVSVTPTKVNSNITCI